MAEPGLHAADSPINPDLLKRFEARTFRSASGKTVNYRLFRPAAGSTTNLPLVLFLHGAAGLGDDNRRQFNGGNEVPPLALTAPAAQARFPSFVLAPQCPRGTSWTSTLAGDAMMELTLGLTEAVRAEFQLDPDRIYLVGVSMGGIGAWAFAAQHPDRFAAIVPICSSGRTDSVKPLTRLPIWCFHGTDDPLISVENPRRLIAALREAGGKPRYTEYPGVGHDSYRTAFQEPDLLPWLFQQSKRSKQPTAISGHR